jgi:cyanate permease
LWLFGLAFLAAVAVLAFLIWLTMRRGRDSRRAAA